MTLQWADIETGRDLLEAYERRRAQYEKELAAFTQGDQSDDAEKARLQAEYAELQQLYERLSQVRHGIVEKRDANAP